MSNKDDETPPPKATAAVLHFLKNLNNKDIFSSHGGTEKISEAFNNSKNLSMKIELDSDQCLSMSPSQITGAVFKLKINRSNGQIENELKCVVDKLYSADGSIDFQYLPINKSQKFEDLSESCGIEEMAVQHKNWFLENVSIFHGNFSYMISKNSSIEQLQFDKIMDRKDNHGMNKENFVYSFSAENVPDPIPQEQINHVVKESKSNKKYFLEIIQKFNEQPVWNSQFLLDQITKDSNRKVYLVKFLRMVAYRFTDGPWQRLWIRRGYDPRQDKLSKMNQVVWLRAGTQTTISKYYPKSKVINHTVTKENLMYFARSAVQLSQIEIDEVKKEIKKNDGLVFSYLMHNNVFRKISALKLTDGAFQVQLKE
ncbi:MAG: General transcription factor 3C polypeptide 5 [Paramarteilia canceri]